MSDEHSRRPFFFWLLASYEMRKARGFSEGWEFGDLLRYAFNEIGGYAEDWAMDTGRAERCTGGGRLGSVFLLLYFSPDLDSRQPLS